MSDQTVSARYEFSFVDPDHYHSSIVGAGSVYSLLARGTFRAELASATVGRITVQQAREVLPRLALSAMPENRVGLMTWRNQASLPIVRGRQMRRGDWICLGRGMEGHHRISGPSEFVAITMNADGLDRAALEFFGAEMVVEPGRIIRPAGPLGGWLLSLADVALRATGGPRSLTEDVSLERELLQAIIMCLAQANGHNESASRARRAAIAQRFALAVEQSFDDPLTFPDPCHTLGIPSRTLRSLCQEQLGLSPQRFLTLRRLHVAHRALLRSDHTSTTVTEIITRLGVWELGRFAVAYKSLFGESPSAVLRRPYPAPADALPSIGGLRIRAGSA